MTMFAGQTFTSATTASTQTAPTLDEVTAMFATLCREERRERRWLVYHPDNEAYVMDLLRRAGVDLLNLPTTIVLKPHEMAPKQHEDGCPWAAFMQAFDDSRDCPMPFAPVVTYRGEAAFAEPITQTYINTCYNTLPLRNLRAMYFTGWADDDRHWRNREWVRAMPKRARRRWRGKIRAWR